MGDVVQWVAIGLTAMLNLCGFVFLLGRQDEHLRQMDTGMDRLQTDVREIRSILLTQRAQRRHDDMEPS